MAFFLFMVAFTCSLGFILWLIYRTKKPKVKKRTKLTSKKTPHAKKGNSQKPEPTFPSDEQLRKNATELLKKNPEVVTYVVKQWLREK